LCRYNTERARETVGGSWAGKVGLYKVNAVEP
jgi:hypothetical protein